MEAKSKTKSRKMRAKKLTKAEFDLVIKTFRTSKDNSIRAISEKLNINYNRVDGAVNTFLNGKKKKTGL